MRSMWRVGLAAAAAVALAIPAGAQVTFTLGNNPQPGEENVLLNTGLTGNTIVGTTNQSGLPVNFSSTETLTAPSNGQARVEATDNVVGPEALTISMPDSGGQPVTFGDIIFNPFIGGNNKPADNDLTVTVNSTGGTQNFTYTLSNGSNFLTIVADPGVGINSVVLDPVIGFTDLRQIRISGILVGGVPPTGGQVPEPGTWAMMAGMGLPVIGLLRRRRKS